MQTALVRRKSPEEIAFVVSALLDRHLRDPRAPSFALWAKPDRAIVSVNPRNVKDVNALLTDRFVNSLSTSLGGCPVIRADTYGIYYQVGYEPAVQRRLQSLPLNLSEQPSPLHVPVGETENGPLWLHARETGGGVIIGGSTGMGKTTLMHAWIRALIHGQACQLWLYDGKGGKHYGRYGGQPGVTVIDDLTEAMNRLLAEFERRRALCKAVSAHDIDSYNRRATEPLLPIFLFIDEAAFIPREAFPALEEAVAKGREDGFVPFIATQRTSKVELPGSLKTNIQTRIALPVPAGYDSQVILERPGAEKLPKVPGRLMMVYKASIVVAQAYNIDLEAEQPIPDLPVGIDWQLAVRAYQEKGGVLSIPTLAAWGHSEHRARRLLERWTAAGWLVGDGQGVPRRLSEGVLEAISQSLKVASKSQSSSQSSQSGFSGHGSDSAAWIDQNIDEMERE